MPDTTALPVLTVPVGRAPASCPNCHLSHVKWPLAVHAGRVYLACPRCHVNVAKLAATEPEPAPVTTVEVGCTCCDVHEYPEADPDLECPRCGHLYRRHGADVRDPVTILSDLADQWEAGDVDADMVNAHVAAMIAEIRLLNEHAGTDIS